MVVGASRSCGKYRLWMADTHCSLTSISSVRYALPLPFSSLHNEEEEDKFS